MKKSIFIWLLVLSTVVSNGGPHLGFLFPSGGRAGESVQILVGGSRLYGIDCLVTGGGVATQSIEIIRSLPVPTSLQRRFLSKWILGVLRNNPKMPPLPDDPTMRFHPFYESVDQLTPLQMEILVDFLTIPRSPLQMSPAISQRGIITLKIDKNAKPGRRELRLISRGVISNPLPFFIGKNPEYRESPNPFPPEKRKENLITIPSAVNGQIMPGEVDKFSFYAHVNRIYTFTLRGRELVPFMGDCVPGNFQPLMEVLDDRNQSVAFADDYHFNPDPKLTFKVPRSGRYTLLVRDALYRGRADFVYRVEICEGEEKFQLSPPPIHKLPQMGIVSRNQIITHPVLIHGVVNQPRQEDIYHLNLRKGEKIAVEVWARRLGSPLDSNLTILNSKGETMLFNDDYKNFGVNTQTITLKKGEKYPANVNPFNIFLVGTTLHQADSKLIFNPPKDDKYTIKVADSAKQFGDDYQYFLRVEPPKPNFRIYHSPSGIEVGYQRMTPIRFVVERIDEFNEDITITNLPQYFSWGGTPVIPKGANYAWLTVSAKTGGKKPSIPIKLDLQAQSGKIKVPVMPCDEAMQAFAYTHLVPAQQGWISRNWRGRPLLFQWEDDKIVVVEGKGSLILKKPNNLPKDSKIQVSLYDPLLPIEIVNVENLSYGWKINLLAKDKVGSFNLSLKLSHTFTTPATAKSPVRLVKDSQILPIRRVEIIKSAI